MENNDYQEIDFNFLKKENMKKHFSGLHFALLSGKHILKEEDGDFWEVLDAYFAELAYYYELLYNLHLRDKTNENKKYFFLDFYEGTKGKLSDSGKHKELTEKNIFFGILLLNLLFEKQFEKEKRYVWEELQDKIEKSELSALFNHFFFKNKSQTQREKVWDKVKDDFEKAIDEFDKLGWTKWIRKTNFEFEIKVSIYRFIDLYETEINNIQQTIQHYAANRS